MNKVINQICPKMTDTKPRNLMGVGTPMYIVNAVSQGVDIFDCVIPFDTYYEKRTY